MPLALNIFDVAAPAAAGAVGPPHVLLEGCGHDLLARVGKVDAHHVEEASTHHVLDDLVTDPRLVGVKGPDHALLPDAEPQVQGGREGCPDYP